MQTPATHLTHAQAPGSLKDALGSRPEAESANFLYKNGYSPLSSTKLCTLTEHFDFVHAIDSTAGTKGDTLFKADPKNAGSLTLDFQSKAGSALLTRFIDVLFDSGLLQQATQVVGHPLYLTNFLHMITRPGDGGLAWHRDTYAHGDSAPVGPVPSGYKIMIYNEAVDSGSEFEILRGTHRLDFNSARFDRLLAAIGYKNYVFRGAKGAALLFDMSLIHRRRAPTPQQLPRSATIFGFLRTRWQQAAFLPKHQIEIEHYNQRLQQLVV